jgi:hypothetical protein
MKETRAPYAGQDELDGKYYDHLYPVNDIMCSNCCKKYKDKEFVKRAPMVQKAGFCHFCGIYYNFVSTFCQVYLYVGKDSLKRYSRLSQYGNNKEDWERSSDKIRKVTHEKARRFT